MENYYGNKEISMKKKFYRSRDDKILAGLCGGIGKYFEIDSNLVRVIAAFICLTPPGILAYILSWIIVPQTPDIKNKD